MVSQWRANQAQLQQEQEKVQKEEEQRLQKEQEKVQEEERKERLKQESLEKHRRFVEKHPSDFVVLSNIEYKNTSLLGTAVVPEAIYIKNTSEFDLFFI